MKRTELYKLLYDEIKINHPKVDYRWEIIELSKSSTDKSDGWFIHIGFLLPDTNFPDGNKDWHYGRKHYVSPHSCKSEIVNAAFGLYKAFWEHEMREMFTYKGQQIFNPHLDADKLAEFLETRPFDSRESVKA